MTIAIALHLLAAVIWVGGMFFAYVIVRPTAAQQFEPSVKLTLWSAIFGRFFPWVMLSIITLLITGIWMTVALGGMSAAATGLHVHIMLLLGIIMMLIFLHVNFNLFKKLKLAIADHDWIAGDFILTQIRKAIAMNLALGLIVVIVASSGRFF
ncbi:MAG: CopD family protein [Gammaproteobacteria bacterium]|nr:CopD family protein [Gammaproteobacteria bacterium]